MANGKRQQVRIGDLPVTGQPLEPHLGRPCQIEVVRPELVPGEIGDGPQDRRRFPRRSRVGKDLPIRGNADEAGLRDGSSRPRGGRSVGEPVDRTTMMNVGRPRERHQHVDVEQRRHESSLAARTISGVIGGLSRSTTKPGIGRSVSTGRGRPPRRARSDSAAPSETRRSCASARAMARTSSSTFSVVRIRSSSYHRITLQNETVAVIEIVRCVASPHSDSAKPAYYAAATALTSKLPRKRRLSRPPRHPSLRHPAATLPDVD